MDAKAEKILLGANHLRVLVAGYPNDPGRIGPRRQLYVADKHGARRLNESLLHIAYGIKPPPKQGGTVGSSPTLAVNG